ncbi:MAG: ATP-binding cassette domain-containing protein, partial [bacterium]|nr:ATP-binding cassette domain-containing protein [bacterium]
MNIENLSMNFGTQVIFDNASVLLNNNDKVGIIGVNGAGKSTLFKLILNELEPISGTINLNNKSIGYLPQVITDEIPSND